jgi:PAS domain S-box-containing protein
MVDCTSGRGAVLDHVWRALLDNLDQGVFVADPQGTCLVVNRHLAQWLGRHAIDLVGRPAAELFPARADRWPALLEHVLHGERCDREELVLLGDEVRLWRIAQLPVRDEGGDVVGLLGLCRDVTEDRQREEEVRQARRLAGLERHVADLAHDLRNLLTVVGGHLDLLRLLESPEVDQELEPLLAATERSIELSGCLLNLSRIAECGMRHAELKTEDVPSLSSLCHSAIRNPQSAMRETIDLNGILTEAAALLRTRLRPGVQLEVRGRAPLPRVAADAWQMSRLLVQIGLALLDSLTDGDRLRLETDTVRIADCGLRIAELQTADVPVLASLYHSAIRNPQSAMQGMESHRGRRPGLFVRLTALSRPGDGRSQIAIFETEEIAALASVCPSANCNRRSAMREASSLLSQYGGWLESSSSSGGGTCLQIFLPAASE